MPSILGASTPTAAVQEALENTGRLISRHLQDDRYYPDLSELLNVIAHNMPSVSGISDMDYPLQGPGVMSFPCLPEISAVRRVPLPPELVEQFSRVEARLPLQFEPFLILLGDVAYFDGLSETILSAGLVKPKEGIFQPHIQYLLVLATPVDIVILGLSFPGSQAGRLDLVFLVILCFTFKFISNFTLVFTYSLQVHWFTVNQDTALSVMIFGAEAGWFSQRCRKINHSKSTLSFLVPSVLQFTFSEDDPIVQIAIDNSRNTLYTRSEKGFIQVYDLGLDGQGMSRVAALSQNSIVSAAGNIARTIDRSVFKPIVHIAVIERSESIDCHLLAITHAGVRLYFSTTPFKQPMARPCMLVLVHIRLPPGFSASATLQKPAKVHKALYSKGVLLMAASETEDSDILWCINHDSFPFQKPLIEAQMTSNVDGHSWALSAIEDSKTEKIVTPLNKDLIPITDSPIVVQQHILSPKKFVLLSAKGSHIFHKLRPVDQLRHLLVSNAGGEGEEIERFFKLHREEQACATCMVLSCSTAAYDREVAVWATRAFFRYGGEAQMRFPSALSAPSNVGPIFSSPVPGSPLPFGSPLPNPSFLATPAPGMQPQSVSTPFILASPVGQTGGPLAAMAGPEVVFSGKHNGICIYFTRILGNIWDGSIGIEKTFNTGNQVVTTQRLLGFMRPDGGSSQQVQQDLQRKYHTEAQAYEKISLQGIQQLVHRTCQTLALWKLICDHQFSVIIADLQKDFQEQMKLISFKDIVIHGKELMGALITSLINRYIGDNASVDAISFHLREICPLLYSNDDSVCSKANELLQSTRLVQNKTEKEKMLRESLRQYQQISHQTDLPHVCAQYRQVRFYEGVVELCLTAADKKDPQRLGPHFYKNGEPEEDTVGQQAFQDRLNCYKCITDTIQDLVNQSKAAPQSPSVPKQPGPPVMSSDPNMLSNEDATAHFEQMLGLAQRSNDELFHIALYNWLIQADLTDKLLEVNSPYLEDHLMRMIKQDQNKVCYMDLLWRYYEKNKSFNKASHVLARLADMHSTEITLQQRLEYISRAILSAKSSTSATSQAADGEFLHELEEKMEVARIQLQIQETLSRQYSQHPSVQGALSQLDSELMDITKLYGEFADLFRLSECKLAIIHCAGHSDPILVHTLWNEIIEKELSDSVAMGAADRMQALSLKLVFLGKIYAGTPRYFPLELSDSVAMGAADRMQALSLKLVFLGKIYAGTPRYFPLEFLVKTLELQICQLGWDVGFVTYTMQEIGVQLPRLLEVYDHLFKIRDPCWQRLKKALHLLDCIYILLSGYVEDPNKVPASDRRRFTNVCLDNLCAYLVELQSLAPNHALQQTIGNFKSLQAKLQKIY
ncbi:UNVERIFIED_CONTAM: hypothetical protein FKN15_005580 [Acipenser sinensis]